MYFKRKAEVKKGLFEELRNEFPEKIKRLIEVVAE